jgi:uncharacterized delta-60 repeat protein
MGLWRYNADGTPDATFGNNGLVSDDNTSGGSQTELGRDVVVDAAGRILVAGYSLNQTSNNDMIIWCYRSDGTLDPDFGVGGIATSSNVAGGGDTYAEAIALDASGRILVTGLANNGTNFDMVLWRYESNGTLDTTFGANGVVIENNTSGGDDVEKGYDVTTDASGRILVTGYSRNPSGYAEMVVWCYDSNGSRAASFGTNGVVIENNITAPNRNIEGWGIAVDASNRIVVTGEAHNGSDYDMALWRFESNGTRDATFGTNGVVTSHGAAAAAGGGDDRGWDVAIDKQGRILVAGDSSNNTNMDMVLWRYESNGTLDSGFDDDGIAIHNINNGSDRAEALVLDADGKIVSTGTDGNGNMALWRHMP